MVTIRDTSRMSAPRTPSPNGRAAQMGDLGLNAVAETLSRTGKGLQNAADRRAAEAFDTTQGQFDAGYLADAQTYDGRAPGFAREQMAKYDGHLTATAEAFGDDHDARAAFERLRPARRTAQFEAALRVETQRSGERQREEVQRTTSLGALQRVSGIRVAYAAQKKALLDSYDGSTPGLTDNALSAFDTIAATAMADAPPDVKEALAVQLAALRGDEWMSLQTLEGRAREVHDATTATKTADNLVAAVISDPGQYASAVRDAATLGATMPAVLGQQLVRDTTRAITVARFDGIIQQGHWETALTELDAGSYDGALGAEAKAQVRQRATQARAAAGFDPVSTQRELDRQTVERRVQSDLASILTTGKATDLAEADVAAVGGPVAQAAFARQRAQATQAYSVTRGLAGLPRAEQLARVESLKPAGGEADFAERQQIYDLAVNALAASQALQVNDPAKAVLTNEATAALWRRYQAGPTGESAATYAADTLARQRAMGTPETGLRILPSDYARQIAGRVKNAEGADTLPALQQAAALVNQFGTNEGRILTELTRAGMDAADAAIVGQVGNNAVALEQYARARARGNTGLTPTVQRDARAQVVDRLGPLLETLAPAEGGQQGTDALVTGVTRVASALVADGRSPRQAAAEATQVYLDGYSFRGGFRIPRAIAARPATVNYPTPDGGPRRQNRPADVAISVGTAGTVEDLAANGGAALGAYGTEPYLSDAQKRARQAHNIAYQGRWISTLDDSGLMLTIRDPRRPGGVVPVLGADGQPIRRTWAQLLARAAR